MDDVEEIRAMQAQGFVCSQIIMKMGLDLLGKEDADLVRTVHGLAGGLGYTGDVCGALTSGVCLLGLYAGRGLAEEQDNPKLLFMVEDLVKWFNTEYGLPNGGIHCDNIINNEASKMAAVCPLIISAVFQKVKDLLVENGFDLSGMEY